VALVEVGLELGEKEKQGANRWIRAPCLLRFI